MADVAPSSPFALSQAGLVAWKNQGNLIRARSWFERLASVDPEHPSVIAFEAQIGEKLGAGAPGAVAEPVVAARPPSRKPSQLPRSRPPKPSLRRR